MDWPIKIESILSTHFKGWLPPPSVITMPSPLEVEGRGWLTGCNEF
jgi:hypothetical protein